MMKTLPTLAAIVLLVGTSSALAQSPGEKPDTSTSSSSQYTGSGVAGTSNKDQTGASAMSQGSQNMPESDANRTTKADKAMTRNRTKVSRGLAGHDSDTSAGQGNGTASTIASPPTSSRAYTNGATGTSDDNGTPHH